MVLKFRDLKKATEGTLLAVEEQAVRKRSIKRHIDKGDSLLSITLMREIAFIYRMCENREKHLLI